MSPPDGRRRYLPDRQKLPHQRRDDRKILRLPYQDAARRRRHQRHEAEAKQEEKRAETLKPNDVYVPLAYDKQIYTASHAGVAEPADATDLSQFECSTGNRRCRTAQIRGNLKWQSRAKPGRNVPAGKV